MTRKIELTKDEVAQALVEYVAKHGETGVLTMYEYSLDGAVTVTMERKKQA